MLCYVIVFSRDMIKYAYYYQFIQLIILFFMHCYWTLFMLKIVFSYAVKPNYSNVYDNKDFKKQFIKKSDWDMFNRSKEEEDDENECLYQLPSLSCLCPYNLYS